MINNYPILKTEKTEELTLYVIVDCAHLEHTFYRDLRKENDLLYRSLYQGTVNEMSAYASPILIQIIPDKNQTTIDMLQEVEKEHPAVLWLWSGKPFDLTFYDLQSLMQGEKEDGQKIFVRYYDPRCIEMFVEYFQTNKETVDRIESVAGWAFGNAQEGYTYL